MDPVTIGAVLLAIVSGAGNQLGTQLWEGVVSLVSRPFHRKAAMSNDAAVAVVPAGEAELAALQRAPGDQRPQWMAYNSEPVSFFFAAFLGAFFSDWATLSGFAA